MDVIPSHVEDPKKDVVETSQSTWSSLFGRMVGGKSYFPLVTSKSYQEKSEFQIFIVDSIVDYSISTMDFTLFGKFLGAHPEVDGLRNMVKRKWALYG